MCQGNDLDNNDGSNEPWNWSFTFNDDKRMIFNSKLSKSRDNVWFLDVKRYSALLLSSPYRHQSKPRSPCPAKDKRLAQPKVSRTPIKCLGHHTRGPGHHRVSKLPYRIQDPKQCLGHHTRPKLPFRTQITTQGSGHPTRPRSLYITQSPQREGDALLYTWCFLTFLQQESRHSTTSREKKKCIYAAGRRKLCQF